VRPQFVPVRSSPDLPLHPRFKSLYFYRVLTERVGDRPELKRTTRKSVVRMRRPRPTPRKVAPATERMTDAELGALADSASYIGSEQHKDVPAMGLVPKPRRGAVGIDTANVSGVDNPDCTICPRKWAGKQEQATSLLRDGIRLGQVSNDAAPGILPARVWVRDPEDRSIVYEAKRLSSPATGYKAYPLTTRQSRNLPLTVR